MGAMPRGRAAQAPHGPRSDRQSAKPLTFCGVLPAIAGSVCSPGSKPFVAVDTVPSSIIMSVSLSSSVDSSVPAQAMVNVRECGRAVNR